MKSSFIHEYIQPFSQGIFIDIQKVYILFDGFTYNKQLLDEVEHDSENYQGRGLCYLPKPKAEADNTNRGLDNFAIMRKPNPIIVLLYNYKCTSVETFHRTTTK